ncbi:cupin domain-containing protein [Nocardia sp. alder85J]|uniref:cupin domain-containing protein n=1 Tax=Nocardia sp. alder85J TaxID=2862949 RepID=UPI001CD52439|nr:hypothetical protein [Nocardia sp. alder85J]MCX4096822.1 hypothetical protein [Nocardia sp. alder85J]
MSTNQHGKAMVFYRTEDRVSLDDDGMMSPPAIDPSVFEAHDLGPINDGSRVTVLFKGSGGPDAFSLVHAWFGPGYLLPRHSHSADCLYYVVSGEIVMGNRVLKAGEGFFIESDAVYAYSAGPEGAEVLEFRNSTSFDMKIADQTPQRWQPIIDAATANHAAWVAPGGPAAPQPA